MNVNETIKSGRTTKKKSFFPNKQITKKKITIKNKIIPVIK